jgi:hypothetical protein
MHFILDHVFKSLVKDRSRENEARDHLTSYARHQQIFAVKAITVLEQQLTHFINRVSTECSTVFALAFKHASFA